MGLRHLMQHTILSLDRTNVHMRQDVLNHCLMTPLVENHKHSPRQGLDVFHTGLLKYVYFMKKNYIVFRINVQNDAKSPGGSMS